MFIKKIEKGLVEFQCDVCDKILNNLNLIRVIDDDTIKETHKLNIKVINNQIKLVS